MPVTYLLEFHVKPPEVARFRSLLGEVLDAMRHEENFVAAALSVDPEDEAHFLLHETWADHDDVVSVQLARPYRAAWHAALPKLLETDRIVSIWSPVRSD